MVGSNLHGWVYMMDFPPELQKCWFLGEGKKIIYENPWLSAAIRTLWLLVFLQLPLSDLPCNQTWGSWKGSWQTRCIPQRSRIGAALE